MKTSHNDAQNSVGRSITQNCVHVDQYYPNNQYYPYYPFYPFYPYQPYIPIVNTPTIQQKYNFTPPLLEPEVNIMVNNNRIKKNLKSNSLLNEVYLNEGEFALEIINKSSVILGAKITMNGKLLSNQHLIFYPGQRILLDRFIETKDKFKYVVYTVDNNDKEIEAAIKNNGNILIQFYQEINYSVHIAPAFNTNNGIGTYNFANNINNCTLDSFTDNADTTRCYFDSTLTGSDNQSVNSVKPNTKETGMIDKGSKSDQEFTTIDKTFEYTSVFSKEFKLLPISQKPIEARDLINHCSNCGFKLNRKDKFCSDCGKQI